MCVYVHGVVHTHTRRDKNAQRPTADTHRNSQQFKHILRHELKHSTLTPNYHTKTEPHPRQSHSAGKHKCRALSRESLQTQESQTGRERKTARDMFPVRDRSEAAFTHKET